MKKTKKKLNIFFPIHHVWYVNPTFDTKEVTMCVSIEALTHWIHNCIEMSGPFSERNFSYCMMKICKYDIKLYWARDWYDWTISKFNPFIMSKGFFFITQNLSNCCSKLAKNSLIEKKCRIPAKIVTLMQKSECP